MFSYVAKSLLSKTLKTFLRKYLEHIELDSIDYGSSSSADNNSASGSGWGVRLSNVKLREGMELMKLPGKRKRVVLVKKKVKRMKKKRRETPRVKDTNLDTTSNVDLETGHGNLIQPVMVEEKKRVQHIDIDVSDSREIFPPKGIEMESLPLHKQTPNREHLLSIDSDMGYFSSNPSTPVQSTNTMCGAPSSFCLGSNSAGEACDNSQNTVSADFPLPLQQDENDMIKPLTPAIQKRINNRSLMFDTDKDRDSASNETWHRHESIADAIKDTCIADEKHEEEEEDADSYIEVEVEEERIVEDDMALVVGAGGVIGALNIRYAKILFCGELLNLLCAYECWFLIKIHFSFISLQACWQRTPHNC